MKEVHFWKGIILGVYSRGLYIHRPAPCIGGLYRVSHIISAVNIIRIGGRWQHDKSICQWPATNWIRHKHRMRVKCFTAAHI